MATLGKRKAEEAKRPNKRMRQREMKKVARSIPTQQQSSSSLSANAPPSSDQAGRIVKLPGQIQVDKYLSSYSYEIEALQNAIKLSSYGSSIRAWQMLPRHKRRRNASHNLLALPKRLREKGKAELRASNTNATARSEMRRKKGKGDRLALGAYPRRRESTRRSELIQRATKAVLTGKAWMETHLWHAKRFRMSGMAGKVIADKETPSPHRWGFSLPEESSMKSYRSTWRDEKKSVSVMDVSYDTWFRIKASVASREEISQADSDLGRVLRKAGLIDGWQEEWRDGRKCCKTILTASPRTHSEDEEAADDRGLPILRCCGHAEVIWLPSEHSPSVESSRKHKDVLLRTHPAAAPNLLRSLHLAVVALSRGMTSKVTIQRLNSLPHPYVVAGSGAAGRRHSQAESASKSKVKVMTKYLDSLQKTWQRGEAFNTFELGGPLAASLLAKVLRPINGEEESKMAATLEGSLGDGAIVPFEVHDPRLSFPPRSPPKKDGSTETSSASWSPYSRLLFEGAPPPSYRKGEIDRRRSKLTLPGSRLLPTSKDEIVPVVVISHHRKGAGNSLTLLVPRGWGQAFWLSLVHPGTRVVGQVMSRALNFDKGRPSFPFDWAGAPGFEQQEEIDSIIASDEWLRKPPAKRCNMSKLGVRWPFGGSGLWIEVVQNGQQIAKIPRDLQEQKQDAPWMFASTPDLPMDILTQTYRSGNLAPLALLKLKSALVCVELTACRKGSFEKWDEIHFLDKSQQKSWRSALLRVQQDPHSKVVLQKLESQAAPSSSTHIGSVTTGNFALSRGKVSAFASISLLAFLELLSPIDGEEQKTEAKCRNPIPLDNLVLVKSIQSGVHRVASLRLACL